MGAAAATWRYVGCVGDMWDVLEGEVLRESCWGSTRGDTHRREEEVARGERDHNNQMYNDDEWKVMSGGGVSGREGEEGGCCGL